MGRENNGSSFGRVPDPTIAPIDRLVILPVLIFCGGGGVLFRFRQILSDFVRFCPIPTFGSQLYKIAYSALSSWSSVCPNAPVRSARRPFSFDSAAPFRSIRRPRSAVFAPVTPILQLLAPPSWSSVCLNAPVRSIPPPLSVRFLGPLFPRLT